jgi:hypothetical protein
VTAEAERMTEEALKLTKEGRLRLLTVLADSIEEGSLEEIEAAGMHSLGVLTEELQTPAPTDPEGFGEVGTGCLDELRRIWEPRSGVG